MVTLVALANVPALSLAQQPSGTITGVARDQATGAAIARARVNVVGTNIAVATRDDGSFTLRGIDPGTVEVRVLALGHAAQKQAVTVPAGGTATVQFLLAPVALQLEQVVTTATGEARRLEVGNDIPKINAVQQVADHPVANITDLLNAKAPGVDVLGGTLTGTGQRIRVRGFNSLSLNNDPIFIIDGIRMESATGSSSIGIGGSEPSRISDIDPNTIENVEVVKGPSASALYGTDAANGVIVITTKRGRVGRARFNGFIQRGRLTDRNNYPGAYTLFGHSPTGLNRSAFANNCTLGNVAAGTCIPDSLAHFNIFSDPETTPLHPSYQEAYGADVSGGSETLRYFLQATYNGEQGTYRVPEFDIARLNRDNGFIPGDQLRPNALARASFRGNVNLALGPLVDVGISTSYIASTQRLPQTENNTTGLTSSAYRGPGFKDNVVNGVQLYGYRAFTPGDIFQETVGQEINRFIGSINPEWRPLSWLTSRGNFGVDFTNRVDSDLCRRSQCSDFGTSRLGFKVNNRTNFFKYTFDLNSTAQFDISDAIGSKTTGGVQYVRSTFHRNGALSEDLPPGATTVTAGALPDADESTNYVVTAGFFAEQTFSLRDRLFLTGAFRADNNSAFGTKTTVAVYPKAGLSWIISEESFFRKPGFLNQVRLRGAYGQSGTSPGANDALPFYAATSANIADQSTPAIVFSAVGNPNLKPERATEVEGGADVDMFDTRVSLALTAYKKRTKDALIQRILPPSAGVSAVRFENLGSVRNSGLEASLRGQLLRTRQVGFDATFNYAHNNNKLLSLGGVPPIGATIRQVEGYPLNGVWVRDILSFKDINGDGIIAASEVVVSDSIRYLGRTAPRVEVSFSPGLDLFEQLVRVTANFNHRSGFLLLNSSERIRCQTNNNCRGANDINAPLAEQARTIALREHPARTQAGFWDKGDFTKLREVAITFTAPRSWSGRRSILGAERLSLTLSARNLKTWTRFTGIDPEEVAGPENDVQSTFQSVPPPSFYSLRLNFGF
ncbi:MAG: SusC/RagA family TonB-linked outer membrane protein [Gemmatimonadaceae bacterium]